MSIYTLQYIQLLSSFRKKYQTDMGTPQTELYADDNTLVFSRSKDKVRYRPYHYVCICVFVFICIALGIELRVLFQILGVMNKLGTGNSGEITVTGLASFEGNGLHI